MASRSLRYGASVKLGKEEFHAHKSFSPGLLLTHRQVLERIEEERRCWRGAEERWSGAGVEPPLVTAAPGRRLLDAISANLHAKSLKLNAQGKNKQRSVCCFDVQL